MISALLGDRPLKSRQLWIQNAQSKLLKSITFYRSNLLGKCYGCIAWCEHWSCCNALRQARGTAYPDPVKAALVCEQAGAEGITLHLREDRRHIQDDDVRRMRPLLKNSYEPLSWLWPMKWLPLPKEIQPQHVCFVPEKRQEITTEGWFRCGWDTLMMLKLQHRHCQQSVVMFLYLLMLILHKLMQQWHVVHRPLNIHTGAYADAESEEQQHAELQRIVQGAEYAAAKGLVVNAGHGLNLNNVAAIAAIPQIHELKYWSFDYCR